MVWVVASVSCEIKRNWESLLTGFEVLPVKFIALFNGGESSILSHSPGARSVHRGHMTSLVWELSRDFFLFRRTPIFFGVNWFDEHFLISLSNQFFMDVNFALGFFFGHIEPLLVESDICTRLCSKCSWNQAMTLQDLLLMLNDWFKHHESN